MRGMCFARRAAVPTSSASRPLRLSRDPGPRHISFGAWRAALFAALGLNAASACGGSTEPLPETPDAAAPGTVTTGLRCENPVSGTRLGEATHDTGYETCRGGWYHRTEQLECPSALPRGATIPGRNGGDTCADTSCTEHPHGYCVSFDGPGSAAAFCTYGCVRDDECGDGQVCFCDDPVGRCVPAFCEADADCPGSLCVGNLEEAPCGGHASITFACASESDECRGNAQCEEPESVCRVGSVLDASGAEHRARQCGGRADCGRPYLVEGSARQALVEARTDWLATLTPDLRGLDGDAREALAAHWTALGLMEHASVAAFARFMLELMAVGAPAELVSSAQRALGDEIEHARLCFGLASAYAERALGPGTLGTEGVLNDTPLAATVRATVHEACVGETLAAVEALEALAGATDPAVREVLEKVVRDESEHAELGWRFLQWVLVGASPELREVARHEMASAIDATWTASSEHDAATAERDARPELERHGLCPNDRRNAARRAALVQIVMPLASELLGETDVAPRRQCA